MDMPILSGCDASKKSGNKEVAEKELLEDCVEFLQKLKMNDGVYNGRFGLSMTERAELNDLLKVSRTLK